MRSLQISDTGDCPWTMITRIEMDTSKHVFQLHGVKPLKSQSCARSCGQDLITFFGKLPPAVFALEACGGSYHWARRLQSGPSGEAAAVITSSGFTPSARRLSAITGVVLLLHSQVTRFNELLAAGGRAREPARVQVSDT